MKRTFWKLLALSALLSVSALAAKNRASTFFPRGTGAILNMPPSEFEESMQSTDQLLFLYVFDAEHEKSK